MPPPRPICTLQAEGPGYRLSGPRISSGGLYYDLEGAILSARDRHKHENGATLEIRSESGELVRSVSWDGDGRPYPMPLGQLTA